MGQRAFFLTLKNLKAVNLICEVSVFRFLSELMITYFGSIAIGNYWGIFTYTRS